LGKPSPFSRRTSEGKTNGKADALREGFTSIKEGLLGLGQSIASTKSAQPTNDTEKTLSDVVMALNTQSDAIKAQTNMLTQLMVHLTKSNSSTN